MKREISAPELEAVYKLAARFPNLCDIEPMLDELQNRCDDLGSLALGLDTVQPKSVADLLLLKSSGVLGDAETAGAYIRSRLGIEAIPEPLAAPEGGLPTLPAPSLPHQKHAQPDYTIKDRRVTA